MLRLYEADGETYLGDINMGVIGPGESYHAKNGAYKQVVVKNDGEYTLVDCEIGFTQVGGTMAFQWVLVAVGEEAPGPFQGYAQGPLSIGTLAPDATARLWLNANVPLYAEPNVPVAFGLHAKGSEA